MNVVTLDERLEQLTSAVADLRQHVQTLIPDGNVDAHQTAANQLAWAVARSEAAAATGRMGANNGRSDGARGG